MVFFTGVVYQTAGSQDINAYDTFSGLYGTTTVNVGSGDSPRGAPSNGRGPSASGSEAAAVLPSPPGRAASPGTVSATPAAEPRASQQAVVDQVFALPATRKDWYAQSRWHSLTWSEQGVFDERDSALLGAGAEGALLV